MKIDMENSRIINFTQIKGFLQGTSNVTFSVETREEKYAFIKNIHKQFKYTTLSKKYKSLLIHYIIKVTGYSIPQVKRILLQSFYGNPYRIYHKRHVFAQKYTDEDILVLVKTDTLQGRLNGIATQQILQTEYREFHHEEYKRISQISISYIYVLRKSVLYLSNIAKFLTYTKTNPVKRNIGERKKPEPNGRPGYIRGDSVHQGDHDKVKGVYYINSVDEVTQWQIILCTEKISEAYLTPIIEMLLDQYPFVIKEFHTDNGSEYINQWLVDLLNKILIKLTKNRSRKTTDNAQCESKNNIIRKNMGYFYINQKFAPVINIFMIYTFNVYLNFHKPCGFATVKTDAKGKEKKVYKKENYMTPYKKLISIPDFEKYLKPGITAESLKAIATCMSPNEYASIVQTKKKKLFADIGLNPFDF
jgi:hypothetical protein